MTSTGRVIHDLNLPSPEAAGTSAEEFLDTLPGPTWITVRGRDRSRHRVITTLLHGNEPSGLRALHRWYRSNPEPQVDVDCFIASVRAARTPPLFSHRFAPGETDQNRCFHGPFEGPQGGVAGAFLARVRNLRPEAIVDLHNTSGSGPAYGVATRFDPVRRKVCAYFSGRFILTDLRMGALMEATEDEFPTLTVECGGARDPEADRIAWEGLQRFVSAPSLDPAEPDDQPVKLLQHPIRVELRKKATVAYASGPDPKVDLTLFEDVDRFNYESLKAGQTLGWVGPKGLGAISALDAGGRERVEEVFVAEEGRLRVTGASHLYMVTTQASIARSDCLFYIIPGGSA